MLCILRYCFFDQDDTLLDFVDEFLDCLVAVIPVLAVQVQSGCSSEQHVDIYVFSHFYILLFNKPANIIQLSCLVFNTIKQHNIIKLDRRCCMGDLKYRTRLSTSVNSGLYKAIYNYSIETRIPLSRLVDDALEKYLKENNIPYQLSDEFKKQIK